MKIKAGKFTLALTMIVSGVLMLVNIIYDSSMFMNLWMYSPVVLILLGLEIIILNVIYMNSERYKVEVSLGSIILIIFVIAVFMVATNRLNIHSWIFDQIFSD